MPHTELRSINDKNSSVFLVIVPSKLLPSLMVPTRQCNFSVLYPGLVLLEYTTQHL